MLINILNSNNYITFNISIANIFGLNAAVYCSELLNIYKKVEIKNKFIDEKYFKLDRKYIFERTTLCIEDQLVVDQNLMKLGIITKHDDNPDIINFDFNKLISIAISDDKSTLDKISKKVKIESPKGIRESKRQRNITIMKNSIVCPNYELLTALRNWVDAIYAGPHGYLSKIAVEEFQKGLNNYTQGDLDLALRIVKIASIQGYKNVDFAIQLYEKDQRIKNNQRNITQSRLPRTTVQKVTTEKEVDESVVF